MPGLGFQIPFVHIIRIRDVREHTMDIHPQPVITKDNVEIQVDGIMWVRPTIDEESIKRTFYNIDDWKRAIIQLAMTNLRQEFGDLTLDESLVARETIATNLQRILNTFAVEWGLTVSKVEIRLIDPPEDIKKAMHKQKTAEQERRSMRLLATGEFEAAEQQKLAIIQRAEGEREAVIQVAQGKAEAIRLVNEAAEKYFRRQCPGSQANGDDRKLPARERQDRHHRARHQPDPVAGQPAGHCVERRETRVNPGEE